MIRDYLITLAVLVLFSWPVWGPLLVGWAVYEMTGSRGWSIGAAMVVFTLIMPAVINFDRWANRRR